MKKRAAILISISMAFLLTSCGGKKAETLPAGTPASTAEAVTEKADSEETSASEKETTAADTEAAAADNSYEDYPFKEVTLLVCFEAGGTGDLGCRIIAKYLQPYIPCNVINIAGAGGNVGLAEAVQQPADGSYYVLQAAAFPINSALGTATYTWEDFEPVCMTHQSYMGLVVRSDSDYQTFDDFKKAVQEADEGTFKYGLYAGGAMNTTYVTLENALDAHFKVIAIDGKAKSTELLAGRCEAYCDSMASLDPYLKSGEFRCLGVFAPERLSDYPDIPAMAEYGIDNIATDTKFGFWAPKGTPVQVREQFNSAVKKIMNDPEFIAEMNALGFYPSFCDIEEYGAWLSEIYSALQEQLN